jgi:hypothetical protein
MSTVFSPTPASLGLNAADGNARVRRFDGARGLAAMLLAAAVAALVVLADQLIDTWADGHLFLGWVALWVVIFAGSALLAGTARRMASSTLTALDSWSRSLAEARAEARLWELAKLDPRLKAELIQARAREAAAAKPVVTEAADDYSQALAPLGLVSDTAVPMVTRRMAQMEKRRIAGYLPYL